MKKFEKAVPIGKIKLSKNISILMPLDMDDDGELIIAIGMLVQMFTLNRLEKEQDYDHEKFKDMICEYADKVMTLVEERSNDKV